METGDWSASPYSLRKSLFPSTVVSFTVGFPELLSIKRLKTVSGSDSTNDLSFEAASGAAAAQEEKRGKGPKIRAGDEARSGVMLKSWDCGASSDIGEKKIF